MKISHLIFLFVILTEFAFGAKLTGVIRDADDQQPIGFATVQALGSEHSISANAAGEYRLQLPPGTYRIKFSHVAHYSETFEISIDDTDTVKDVYLRPSLIEVSSIKVYDQQYDEAQRIIVEAIKRKDELLSQIKQYSFQAYTKLSARDTAKVDSNSYLVIIESQLDAFWKYPDKQKQIITARRQSANFPAEANLLSVGELLNFNANRIDLGRYAAVSPTATDALDHYEYYLLDTVYIDNRRVFVLEIEPKKKTDPLFVGEIRIADSSYAVVGVDVTFNEGFDDPFVSNERLRQVYSEFESKYWMPTIIQFSAVLDLKAILPVYPVVEIDYQAALHGYDFDPAQIDTVLDEYALEVDKLADEEDSVRWNEGQLMPLTELEERGYEYIDSVENNPSLGKRIAQVSLAGLAFTTSAKDFFHFNRTEGAYLGLGHKFQNIADRFDLRVKSGYAFDAELWQHHYGVDYLLNDDRQLFVGVEYRDEVRTRPTIFAKRDGNATLMALTDKTDSYDYYRERGFSIKTRTKLTGKTRLGLAYNDYDQRSIDKNTDYGLFRQNKDHRPNPPIIEGKLRSLSASFSYDTRPLWKYKGRDQVGYDFPYTTVTATAEYASDDLFDNDFDFSRYEVDIFHARRLFGWAISSFRLFGGASESVLPPQKYYTVDFNPGFLPTLLYFHTLSEENFGGSRVAGFYSRHRFGRKLFQKSGIPLIKDIPFTFSVHGGVFWSDFNGQPYQAGDEDIRVASRPYSELGFGLGRLIPVDFLRIIGLDFTWQLSDYGTEKFNVDLILSLD